MKNLNVLSLLAVIVIAFFFASCEKETNFVSPSTESLTSNNPSLDSRINYNLDLPKIAAGIESRYAGKVSGLSYVIYHNNAVYYLDNGGLGWARSSADAPYRDHGAMERHAIASTSKFPVALLVAKILEKNGKSLEDKIWPYFPTNWKVHPNFKKITFKQLLAHEAGLVKYGNTYADVRKTVEDGINLIMYGTRSYDNINYFMPHYMVAYMIGRLENPALLANLIAVESYPDVVDQMVASLFDTYLRSYVFKPAGLLYWDKVSWKAWDNNGPLDPEKANKFYTTMSPNERGTNIADHTLSSGPGGLVISAHEYGQVASAASLGKIISKNLYGRLRFELLGFDWGGNWKKGYWAAKNGGSRGEELFVDFGNTQVYITTNCNFSTVGNDKNFIVNLVNSNVK